MKYKVIVSDRANELPGMHIRFLAQVNKQAVTKLKNRLVAEMRSLQDMPHRYPFFNENYIPANKYHKLYVENWYLTTVPNQGRYGLCGLDRRLSSGLPVAPEISLNNISFHHLI